MRDAIETFNRIVDQVEARCMATDGPVTPTLKEMSETELAALWRAVQTIREGVAAQPDALTGSGAGDGALRERVVGTLRLHLRGAYDHCIIAGTWRSGAIHKDDLEPIGEQRVHEIAEAVLEALASHPPATGATSDNGGAE